MDSILVVRTDHVGDLICSTPFLRSLRRRCPRATITACVAPATREVLVGNDAVDRIVTEPPTEPRPSGVEATTWLGARPQDEPPQMAIALAPRSRTFKLVARSGARIRAGYLYPERPLVRLMSRWWLTHRVPIEVRSLLAERRVPHEVEQLAHFGRALGLEFSEMKLELPVSPEDLEWGREQARGRVGVHLSAGWLTHGWKLEDFTALCRALPESLITYGPAEQPLVAALSDSGLDLHGGMTLKRWAALLAGCSCVVSPDTGAVHIAASQGRPVVVAYQSEHFELCSQQWYPWNTPHRNLSKGPPQPTVAAIAKAVSELLHP